MTRLAPWMSAGRGSGVTGSGRIAALGRFELSCPTAMHHVKGFGGVGGQPFGLF
jgi:hypothetical protein